MFTGRDLEILVLGLKSIEGYDWSICNSIDHEELNKVLVKLNRMQNLLQEYEVKKR